MNQRLRDIQACEKNEVIGVQIRWEDSIIKLLILSATKCFIKSVLTTPELIFNITQTHTHTLIIHNLYYGIYN